MFNGVTSFTNNANECLNASLKTYLRNGFVNFTSLTDSLYQWFDTKSDELSVFLAGEKRRKHDPKPSRKYKKIKLILTTFYEQLEDIRSLEQKLQLFKEAVFKIGRADDFEEACELWSVDHPLSRILPTTLAAIQTVQANAYNHQNITPENSAPPENDPFDLPQHTYLQQLLNLDGTLDLFDV